MATYDHLPLKKLEGSFERQKHGFGSVPPRDAGEHGARIQSDIEETLVSFSKIPPIDGVNPSLILKITASSLIDEDEWRKLGMVLLSSDGDNSVVLFANDKSLAEFVRKVEAYQGELPLGRKLPPFSGLIAAVDTVGLLAPSDRIGSALQASGVANAADFKDGIAYLLDVELHYPPARPDIELFLFRLQTCVGSNGGRVLSTYAGNHLLLARIEAPGEAVREVLELPEVAKVDLPPTPDFFSEDLNEVDLSDVTPGADAPKDSVVIGIIDTGVNFGHPLLRGAEAGSITLDPSGSIADERGHGTQVASIAAFGDIAARAASNAFDQQFRIASARVLDDRGSFLKHRSMADMMNEAIRELHDRFGCRIFNISLGDDRKPYCGGKVDTWSASLDHISRELDVLIIVSAGNRNDLTASFSDRIIAEYPHFLSEEGSRVIEPATAALVLTIGAIAHSNGVDEDDMDYVGVRPICDADEPAPFTRSGPGVRGMIKPELVDLGGTAVWDGPSQRVVTGSQKAHAGVWAFSNRPTERLLVSRSGTSLAAPNVAYKAALLLTRFPTASANLLRCLLGLSASVPSAAAAKHGELAQKHPIGFCGHGLSNPTHAATSDDGRVVLYAEDELELDHFSIFEVPIPREFQTTAGAKEIKVSLAFDPPVRHTRADYMGVSMAWRLLRGSSQQEVYERFRKWKKEEGKPPKFAPKFVCPSSPGPDLRGAGTLQVGTYTGRVDISAYGDRYFIAVWALRRWAPPIIEKQKFALAVQLRHETVNTLYATLRQPVKV